MEIFLATEVPLSSWCLDLIKNLFSNKFQKKVSIILRDNIRTVQSYSLSSESFVLADEENIPDFSVNRASLKCIDFPLAWVLACRKDILRKYLPEASLPGNLEEYLKLLRSVRSINPHFFPWFEGLFNKQTLFCVQMLTGKKQRSSVSFFFSIFEQNLMNPLSIETDEVLAFDVLDAGDTIFSSLWLPEAVLESKEVYFKKHEISWLPFPGVSSETIIPRVTLKFFSLNSEKSPLKPFEENNSNDFYSSLPSAVFRNYSLNDVQEWIENEHPALYRKIVMGDL
ncbi:MAG: hypothetical protein HQM10_04640 [Candidatus Riflebacteria bacterium]|nr:hypothetical protein [Candidatus Riflebacteria bacterium]